MFKTGSSLLDTRSLITEDIQALFNLADEFDRKGMLQGRYLQAPATRKVIACLFFEPSTRTRMSFQMAAYRIAVDSINLESTAGSSLVKGESLEDTVANVLAMQPDALVVRYGISAELDQLLPTIKIPVLSAGSGTTAHPSQALLDAYTILKERGQIKGERVLIIGDILHSRVAASNIDILTRLGAEVGLLGPDALLPSQQAASISAAQTTRFKNLKEALEWATVSMSLRMQRERHDPETLTFDSIADYHSQYGLNEAVLKNLSPQAIILHPGPINHGVEFALSVNQDPRSRVLTQVKNGVLLRAALLARVLGITETGRIA